MALKVGFNFLSGGFFYNETTFLPPYALCKMQAYSLMPSEKYFYLLYVERKKVSDGFFSVGLIRMPSRLKR